MFIKMYTQKTWHEYAFYEYIVWRRVSKAIFKEQCLVSALTEYGLCTYFQIVKFFFFKSVSTICIIWDRFSV